MNYDLIHPAFQDIKRLLPAVPMRLKGEAVAKALADGCTAQRAAMPWVWAWTVGDEVKIGVNETRIATKLVAEGHPEIHAHLGEYTRLLTTVIKRDLVEEVEREGSSVMQVFDRPVLDVPVPSAEDAARVRQAAATAGMTLAEFHSTILMRTLH